jgi:hypothetical protein
MLMVLCYQELVLTYLIPQALEKYGLEIWRQHES